MKNEQKNHKNEQKTVIFDHKKAIFGVVTGVGVAILMVYIFGKLAPVAIVSYRMGHQIIKSFIM